MQKITRPLSMLFLFISGSVVLSSFNNIQPDKNKFSMPYKQAGLTHRQAAAHLLDRFSFGATPAAIDEVVHTGLEKWFEQQLEGRENDDVVKDHLKAYDVLTMSNEQIVKNFPRRAKIVKSAVEEGIISKEALGKSDKDQYKLQVLDYMKQKGFRTEKELLRQFVDQKIVTAAYSNNQLHQVLTEFWFNHFNVSATKKECAQFIPAFERDVIRPNVAGKFYDLLLATAQSPAMLVFLDNFTSSGVNEEMQAQQQKNQQRFEEKMKDAIEENSAEEKNKMLEKIKQNKKSQGLNENYAREIMELHTLGVDGGYTQNDVTEAARVLTGWTVYPIMDLGPTNFAKKMIEKFGEENLIRRGFVHQGDFLFAMNRHDTKEKVVLNKTFAAGGGFDEGLQLISMLAHHSSTARFISRKLAVKFVSDNPPQSLIDKMASAFIKYEGDIKQVLIAMVSAPEFWAREALREKTKSPFELVISAVRSLHASMENPFVLYQWITKMGQNMYHYQAPTGFPDKGKYWINTGSLLNRMKFGLAFASKKIPGISFNLIFINNNHEPESAEAALITYSKLILPERNVDATIKRLAPFINDQSINKKIDEAAGKSIDQDNNSVVTNKREDEMVEFPNANKKMSEEELEKPLVRKVNKSGDITMASIAGDNGMLAQVVGIILGSPEFQRR